MKITRDLCGTTQVLEKVQQMFAQEGKRNEDNSLEGCFNTDDLKSDPSTGENDRFRNMTEDHHTGSSGQPTTYSSENNAIRTQSNLLNPNKNNLMILKQTHSKTDKERIDSSLEISLNLLKPECQIMSDNTVRYSTVTSQAEIWEPIGIVEATKPSQNLMFEPTGCIGINICNVKENNKTQSQNQQETENESVQVCLQDDTCSMPMEYEGVAFFLDSCQEAFAFDAALLAVNEMGWCEDRNKTGVRVQSAENTRQTFFITKMELNKIFNCVVL